MIYMKSRNHYFFAQKTAIFYGGAYGNRTHNSTMPLLYIPIILMPRYLYIKKLLKQNSLSSFGGEEGI